MNISNVSLLIFLLFLDTNYFTKKYWFKKIYFALKKTINKSTKFTNFFWKYCYSFFNFLAYISFVPISRLVINVIFFFFFDYFWMIFLSILVPIFFISFLYFVIFDKKQDLTNKNINNFNIKIYCLVYLMIDNGYHEIILFVSIFLMFQFKWIVFYFLKFAKNFRTSRYIYFFLNIL